MTRDGIDVRELLPAAASSAHRARELVRECLERVGAGPRAEAAELAVSEVVTNALVHAATDVGLHISFVTGVLRVEVTDGSAHLPVTREYACTAGTGRGLMLLADSVDEWGSFHLDTGKVVWFEMREAGAGPTAARPEHTRPSRTDPRTTVQVELANVPLLMHAAWQEHASALLRDFLLVELDADPAAMEHHAQASDAMNLLFEQLPAPDLGDEPESVMAAAVEPRVSLGAATLTVPRSSVAHFATLDDLLDRAVDAADEGRLLVPATQPEVQEMRTWLCTEVRGQTLDGAAPVPWSARTDIWQPVETVGYADWDPREISTAVRALLASDESSVVVAVSPSALALLGYHAEDELLGRRVITIIPPRFRQAHLAGTTLHAVNGRSPLLGVVVTVPLLLADGHEREVGLRIDPHRRSEGRKVYVAEFFPEGAPG